MNPRLEDSTWDVCVVGAGPAGSSVARLLAERGIRVALIDRASFPRGKVCGCCLNGAAFSCLEEAGLGDLPARVGSPGLRLLHLSGYGRHAKVPLTSGFALSRETLDLALVEVAQSAGVTFFPSTTAVLGELESGMWSIEAQVRPAPITVRSRVVVCADGLGGSFLRRHLQFAPRVKPRSKIGVGLQIRAPEAELQPGEIRMILFSGGYAGLVRLENGLIDIASALIPQMFAHRPLEAVIGAILKKEAGIEQFEVATSLRGTPPLTRRRPVGGATRLFILGDAAAYVEPFTGEGIAWAMGSARLLAPLVEEAHRNWKPGLTAEWTRRLEREIGRRHRLCRLVKGVLDHPTLSKLLLVALGSPGWARPLVASLNRPLTERSS